MRVLLDTCVLSELRKPQADAGVRQAVDEIPDDDLFASVISIGEIAKGIALLDDSRRKRELQSWLQALERDYETRILQIDREIAHREHSVILTLPVIVLDGEQIPDQRCRYTWHIARLTSGYRSSRTTKPPSA